MERGAGEVNQHLKYDRRTYRLSWGEMRGQRFVKKPGCIVVGKDWDECCELAAYHMESVGFTSPIMHSLSPIISVNNQGAGL